MKLINKIIDWIHSIDPADKALLVAVILGLILIAIA